MINHVFISFSAVQLYDLFNIHLQMYCSLCHDVVPLGCRSWCFDWQLTASLLQVTIHFIKKTYMQIWWCNMYSLGSNWLWVCSEFSPSGLSSWNLSLKSFSASLRCCLDIKFLSILIIFCFESLSILYLVPSSPSISFASFSPVCKFIRTWSPVGIAWPTWIVCQLDVGWNTSRSSLSICSAFVVTLTSLFSTSSLVSTKTSPSLWFPEPEDKKENSHLLNHLDVNN